MHPSRGGRESDWRLAKELILACGCLRLRSRRHWVPLFPVAFFRAEGELSFPHACREGSSGQKC